MLKLKKYYKPFIGMIICAIILLFIQAMCDLKLPNYMSDIVNVGIQSSGIENVAPSAISQNGFKLITLFMNEESINLVKENYELINKGDKNYIEKYSLLENDDIYVLNENISAETIEKINYEISKSCKILINTISAVSNNLSEVSNISMDNKTEANFDIAKLYEAINMIKAIPEDVIESAREDAKNTDSTTLSSIGLVFTKMFYEELGIDTSKIQIEYIVKIGLKMLFVCAVGIVAAVGVGFLGSKTGAGLGKKLRNAVFEKVESFSNTEFDKFSTSSLITRTTNDITQIQNFTVMMIRMLAYAPIIGIGALITMLRKTNTMIWTIGAGCIFIIALIIVLFVVVLPKIKIVQKLTDRLNLVSKENLSGLMVIRAFGTKEYERKRFDEINTKVMQTNRFINRSMGFMMPYMMLVMNLLNVLILWVGANEIANANIQVGDLMAVMQYGMQVIMSFLMISMIFVMFPRASVSADRIFEILETENSIKNPENPEEFKKDKMGYVEFRNVKFSYPEADEKVLDNISFIAKPGKTTAIIGATGSGKTTLINLIPRFFDVTEGEVLVNGVNVKNIKQEVLHKQIGYIPQKGNLLSGTIESNLKYGNEQASDDLMEKCSQIAQATEFINSKDDKYKSDISQGAKNVSGGQKQRLSIARALVTQSPIYIFDDSFSALDFKTDSNLRVALKENIGDSTLIIVAQRVSTIMHAEQILVLDEGKLVGIGTHEELLKNCKTYYEIASSQLSKEELENGREQ